LNARERCSGRPGKFSRDPVATCRLRAAEGDGIFDFQEQVEERRRFGVRRPSEAATALWIFESFAID
jgi:hypothetical protein